MFADENDAATPWVYLEDNFLGSSERFANGFVAIFGGENQKKTAAAGAQQLAAERAGFAGGPIPVIDTLVGDAKTQGTLEFPSFMQKPAELV